ncbi:MAG: helix-turn-helix transcriptional regulator [Clostridia bacterium]|nr:helix-turn-helix transcriptional regulator [Clostridia bacterium]
MFYNYDNFSFQILSVSKCIHFQGTFNVKSRPYAAIALRLNGNAKFYVNSKHFYSNPGDITFIPENTPYRVSYTEGESIFIHLSDCNYKFPENITVPNTSFFRKEFEKMIYYYSKPRYVNLIKSTIYNILHCISENIFYDINDENFLRCLSYIDNNYCNANVNIEKISAQGFMSQSSLRRKFSRYMGISPLQYLNDKRINKAINLLMTTNITVKEVAHMCGFSDEKYFSRIISARYNTSPSEFLTHR